MPIMALTADDRATGRRLSSWRKRFDEPNPFGSEAYSAWADRVFREFVRLGHAHPVAEYGIWYYDYWRDYPVTPICSEHAALLRGIAAKTKDQTAQKVYADWLQEHGNPGWLIVTCYKAEEWYIRCDDNGQPSRFGPNVKLPWLDGWMPPLRYTNNPQEPYRRRVTNPTQRLKLMLEAYASGNVLTTPFNEEE